MNNKYKLLVVEDEANIRSFMETILDTNGYKVMTAENCEQGIFMFLSHNPDLIILDLGLPDRDGLEFIKAVRRSDVNPIIVLSARTTERIRFRLLTAEQTIILQSRSVQASFLRASEQR